ncbi:MgtC/SapB family protein [Aurantiacibacter gilvus]|uniref:Protein MgtC n=1 Tax=Aurantiacibacter gilvus TaxID=3139141 RepID=A0ABU9IAG2_9SPHN
MELNAPVAAASIDLGLAIRLGAAAVLGLLLGLDREYRGHAAGMRTHGLVCLAAAVMTVSAIALFNGMEPARGDPLRLYEAAGAFVGIIGAGLIVFSKGRVHNLTTAANLWLTAVIGIACGAAQWPLVALATGVALFMLTILRFVERKEHDRRLESKKESPEA